MHILAILPWQPRLQNRLQQRVRPLADRQRLRQPIHARIAVLEEDGLAQLVDGRNEDLPALSVEDWLLRQAPLVNHRLFPADGGALDGRVLEEAGRLVHRRFESGVIRGIFPEPLVVV